VSDLRRLLTWLERARPPRRALASAVVAGLVATLSGVGLSVGALALLVESALRPGLAAVAGVLIVIELLAFLRSPIRFYERVSAHRLGLSAVTRWRRWLVESIGQWSYQRWRSRAAGDLLERSLRDTDELQDLWLRGVVPAVSSLAAALIADVVVGLLPARGSWWPAAGLLALAQVVGVAAVLANYPSLVGADKLVRAQRGRYRAELVELAGATPELAAMGRADYVAGLAHAVDADLEDAELARDRRTRMLRVAAPLATALALLGVVLAHPTSAPLWLVVSALVALSTYDHALIWRSAIESAVAVSGAAERLDELAVAPGQGHAAWPAAATLEVRALRVIEGADETAGAAGSLVVHHANLEVGAGRRVALVGVSGAGKSALLRAIAGLDEIAGGAVSFGGVALADIDEGDLRRHLAYVGADAGLTAGFVRDVIELGRETHRDYVADLASLGLVVTSDTRWGELSRGERQRVAVVRALATSPDIVVLDEPTSGLGEHETAAVLALLERAGAAVLVATHDAHVVAWCDDVVELANGVLVSR
jgi:ABC-type transport system involved in cytochrome bd biosynthesis fused ATPase/permease subunit